eukprot:6242702-Lingulodinium_polyedra.AAC.1
MALRTARGNAAPVFLDGPSWNLAKARAMPPLLSSRLAACANCGASRARPGTGPETAPVP